MSSSYTPRHRSFYHIPIILPLSFSFTSEFWSENLAVFFWDHDENMQRYQGTIINRIFKTRCVWCKFWDSPCSCIRDVVFLAGHFVTRLLRGISSEEAWTKYTLACRCCKTALPKNRPFTSRFAGLLFKYVKDKACTIHGKMQNGGKGLICSLRRNPCLTLRGSWQSPLWPTDDM